MVLFIVDVFWQRDIITSIDAVGNDLGSIDDKMDQLLGSLIGRAFHHQQQSSRQSRNNRRRQDDDIVIGLTVPPPPQLPLLVKQQQRQRLSQQQKNYYPWTGTNIIGLPLPAAAILHPQQTGTAAAGGSLGLWQELSNVNGISRVTVPRQPQQQQEIGQQLDDDEAQHEQQQQQQRHRRSVLQMAKRLWALSRFRLAAAAA